MDRSISNRKKITECPLDSDPSTFFTAFLFVSAIIGIATMIIATEYFGHDSFLTLTSHKPSDKPAHLMPNMYPEPFGVHYFGDFLDTLKHSTIKDTLSNPYMSPAGYPPFSFIVIAPFQLFSYHDSLKLYIILTALLLTIPIWKSRKTLSISNRVLFVSSLFLSAPLIATFDRGNIQGIVVGFALIGLGAFKQGRHFQAGFWFAISAAMKGYPVLLLLLLVKSRSWNALGLSILLGTFFTWSSFQYFDGFSVSSLEHLWNSVAGFRTDSSSILTDRNHSFRGGISALSIVGPIWLSRILNIFEHNYYIFLLVLFSFLTTLIVSKSTPLFNSVIYISILLSYGIGISYGYSQLFLFLVVLTIPDKSSPSSLDTWVAIGGTAFLLAPKPLSFCQGIATYTIIDPVVALLILLIIVPKDIQRLQTSLPFRYFNPK